MHIRRNSIIRPGMFTVQAAADTCRLDFDTKNDSIVINKVTVNFVFIRDSITHSWELQAYFGGTSRKVINRGIAGDKSEFKMMKILNILK